jgi:hypothetical protein
MSPLEVCHLSDKPSSQIHVLQHLLSLCNEHPDRSGFTADEVHRWPLLKKRGTPRKSVVKALERFVRLKIASSPGLDRSGKRLYRVINPELARAYIARDKDRPWLPLTPTLLSRQFPDSDEHRDHFNIRLTKEWFERIKARCAVNNNQYTLRSKGFTLSINGESCAGQLFTKRYWRTFVKREIGEDFYQYLADLESKGGLRGDFCLPIGMKGQRFTIGGRTCQFSASHYEAQVDIQASKCDRNLRDGMAALFNQADFNTKTLDFQDAVLETLKKQGEVQSRSAVAIEKLVQMFFSQPEHSYQASSTGRGDFAYR